MKVHGNAWRGGFVSNTFVFMGCIEWELCIKRKGSEGKVDGVFGPEGYSRLSAAGCVERGDGPSGCGWWWRLAPQYLAPFLWKGVSPQATEDSGLSKKDRGPAGA